MSQIQGIAVSDFQDVFINIVEVLHDREGFFIADDLHIRINGQQIGDGAGVVWFHMVNDEVIHLLITDDGLDLFDIFALFKGFYRIHNSDLVVVDDIGVIGHAILINGPHALKQVGFMVVDADPVNVVFNLYCFHLIFLLCTLILIISSYPDVLKIHSC